MIAKQRLEELIKQNAIIYHVRYCISEIQLSDNYRTNYDGDLLVEKSTGDIWNVNYLFETKEDAEFVANNWKARVEQFKPPLWDEFKRVPHYDFSFWVENCKLWTSEIEIKSNHIFIGDMDFGKATRQHYLKAVEYAKKLFLGEKND